MAGIAIYSGGPALIYVGPLVTPGSAPSTSQVVYLGTFEAPPEIEITPDYEPVMNDLGGPKLPFDRLYEGQEGQMRGNMNRFSMNTIRNLMSPTDLSADPGDIEPGGNLTTGNALKDGQDTLGGAYGGLMNQDGLALTVYVVFARLQPGVAPALVARLTANGMIYGFRFFSGFLIGPHKIRAGSMAYTQSVIFQFQRAIAPNANVGATNLSLYDTKVPTTGLPGIV